MCTKYWTRAFLGASLTLAGISALASQAAALEERRMALNQLLAEQWEFTLREGPEVISSFVAKKPAALCRY